MRLLHIGRALDNEIVVNDTTVSRRHAQLLLHDDGSAQLIDLNSSNGSFVNGHRIHGQVNLDRMDIVKVGDHLLPWRNYLHVQAAAQVQAATAAPVAFQPEQQQVASSLQNPSLEPVSRTPTQKSSRLMIWLASVLAFAGVGVIILVLVFLLVVPKSASADITGRWHEIDDPRAWVEFKSDQTYLDGYANVTLIKDATWSTSGGRTLLIKREGATLVKEYMLEDGILTLRQGNYAIEYESE
jgi:Na+-transporting methylmalonyl-CoA/oxaloacetate decarboxylase gamma subunit